MAGKQIDFALLKRAAGAYCAGAGKEWSEDGQRVLILPDIQVTLVDGKPACEDESVLSEIREILLGLIESGAVECPNLPIKSNGKGNTGMAPRKSNGGPLVKPGAIRDVQVADLTMEDIKAYICPTATDQETFMFLKLCQARNLNPFLKEAYLIKYSGGSPATIVVGKDAFTRRAEEHPQFDGFKAGIIVKAGENLDYREGTFFMQGEELVGAWSEVFRKDRTHPFKSTVSRVEYDTGKSNWLKMPATMLRKVSLVQALREAFASEFSGMYDSSEMAVDAELVES